LLTGVLFLLLAGVLFLLDPFFGVIFFGVFLAGVFLLEVVGFGATTSDSII